MRSKVMPVWGMQTLHFSALIKETSRLTSGTTLPDTRTGHHSAKRILDLCHAIQRIHPLPKGLPRKPPLIESDPVVSLFFIFYLFLCQSNFLLVTNAEVRTHTKAMIKPTNAYRRTFTPIEIPMISQSMKSNA